MTAYVALLRGVNVGNRRVEMPWLKACVEGLGCTDVRTYINSGNVIFRDRRDTRALTALLEEAIGVRVAVRTLGEMQELRGSIPDDWTNDGEQKTDVAFLLDEPGARVFHALRADVKPGRSIVVGVEGELTVRNVNTVRKLTELMERIG